MDQWSSSNTSLMSHDLSRALSKMVENILPRNFQYKIIKSQSISTETFYCEVRSNINSCEDFTTWLREFERNTNTCWILRKSSIDQSRFLFSRNYICQHSSYRKVKTEGKDKKCTASLNIRIKRNSKYTRYRDPLISEGYCAVIHINNNHSHRTGVAEAWNWLRRSEETQDIFINLFNNGMTPAAAKNFHESSLMIESPRTTGQQQN
ncbi:uncharacterized protein LOC118193842 [Stegodyphus dumicola]|uniref:uncharacterized protein LOC118193842 n=1 Tax=Stegodyphus dumicola TaxID=202533 RepID=UPI0015AF5A92|nr:uncharacterized protein LOC118193842 [Stegodyphus dumicola]